MARILRAQNFRVKALNALVMVIGIHLSAMFYLYSLQGGDLDWLHANVFSLAVGVVISFLIALGILLWITVAPHRMVSWRLKGFIASLGAVMILILWTYDNGDTPESHGLFNRLGWAMGFCIGALVMEGTLVVYRYAGIKVVVGVYLVVAMIFALRMAHGYSVWADGFSGQRLLPVSTCVLQSPAFAWADVLPAGWLNFWTGSYSCDHVSQFATFTNEGVLQHKCPATSKARYRTLPSTQHIPPENKTFPAIQRWIVNNMSPWTPLEQRSVHLPRVEAVLVQCGSEERLLVRNAPLPEVLHRNHSKDPSAAHENHPQANHTKDGRTPHPNVLILYVDAVSRRHFLRRFPKTVAWLEEINEGDVASAYQFFRYSSSGFYTRRNTNRLFQGRKERMPAPRPGVDNKYPAIWELYQRHGYATATIDNSCQDWGMLYAGGPAIVDHQFVAPFCLPEYYPLENPYGNFQGPFSMRRRCLRGKPVHRYSLSYLKSFWDNYADVPKFGLAWFTEGHEGTGEVVGLLDKDFEQYLRTHVDYHNTIVVLLSDHGLHMGVFYAFGAHQTMLEHRLPLLNVIVPNAYLRARPGAHDALQHNQQALVGAYDVFESLLGILGEDVELRRARSGRYPKEPKDLFTHHVAYNRTCRSAGISPRVCSCTIGMESTSTQA